MLKESRNPNINRKKTENIITKAIATPALGGKAAILPAALLNTEGHDASPVEAAKRVKERFDIGYKEGGNSIKAGLDYVHNNKHLPEAK